MLRRLKRRQGARDLPGGGGEVKVLRAVVSQSVMGGQGEGDDVFAVQRGAARTERCSDGFVQLCALSAEVQQQHKTAGDGRARMAMGDY